MSVNIPPHVPPIVPPSSSSLAVPRCSSRWRMVVFCTVYLAAWLALIVRWPAVWSGELGWFGMPRALWWVVVVLGAMFVALLVLLGSEQPVTEGGGAGAR